MRLSHLLLAISRFLLVPAVMATMILYLYPAAQNCGFPAPAPLAAGPTTTSASVVAFRPRPGRVFDASSRVSSSGLSFSPSSSGKQKQGGEEDENGGEKSEAAQCAFDGGDEEGGKKGSLKEGFMEAWREIWGLMFEKKRERRAPFRLLALGDPQLEGLSSRVVVAPSFTYLRSLVPRLRASPFSTWRAVFAEVGRETLREMGKWTALKRKEVDLWGNDWYLHHVVWLVKWWTQPTHVVVLGDLLGSQWVGDEEFEARSQRFWGRVFRGLERVGEGDMVGDEMEVAVQEEKDVERGEGGEEGEGEEGEKRKLYIGRVTEIGSPAYEAWKNKLINVAGNHDIGYAGDINENRLQRFEREFGKLNWNQRFVLPIPGPTSNTPNTDTSNTDTKNTPPELDIMILNSMLLDSPALHPHLQKQTWHHLQTFINESRARAHPSRATILLTHIPLHKDAGICADAPMVEFFPEEYGGGVREQNHLSPETSGVILEGLFGGDGEGQVGGASGGGGIVLVGHDHEGCDVVHSRHRSTPALEEETEEEGAQWTAHRNRPFPSPPHRPSSPSPSSSSSQTPITIREITVRSMMGAYSGTTGLLSAWFDDETKLWRFEYSSCALGVQHFWWGVHVLDLVVVALGVAGAVAWVVEVWWWMRATRVRGGEGFVGHTRKEKEKEKKTMDAEVERRGVEMRERDVVPVLSDGEQINGAHHQEDPTTPEPVRHEQRRKTDDKTPTIPTPTATVESVEVADVVPHVVSSRVTRARRAALRDTERRPSRM